MTLKFKSIALNAILEAELAAGNRITEISAWPPHCDTLIILEFRFIKPYDVPALEYHELNDTHYWYAEYAHSERKETLACRFKTNPR